MRWIKRIAFAVVALLVLLGIGLATLLYFLTSRVEGDYFDANGFTIHYTVDGNATGEPVILIHGLGANIDLNWRRPGTIGRLARDFHVISYDLRGHGLSDRSHDAADYGIELVHDVFRMMDHAGLESAHLVGYSMGGFVALKAAAENPERVRSVSVAAAGWRDPRSDEPLLKPYRSPQHQPRPIQEARIPNDPDFEGWGGRPFLVRLADPFRDYVGEKIGDEGSFRACKSDESLESLQITQEELEALTTPIACFIGDDDGLLWYAHDLLEVRPDIAYFEYGRLNHLTLGMAGRFRRDLHAFLLENASGNSKPAVVAAPSGG